jgi:hypothetical protein
VVPVGDEYVNRALYLSACKQERQVPATATATAPTAKRLPVGNVAGSARVACDGMGTLGIQARGPK